VADIDGEDLPPIPPSLMEVPLSELIDRARIHGDRRATRIERGELVTTLRHRGLSWRQIEQQTGIPYVTAYRWLARYREHLAS